MDPLAHTLVGATLAESPLASKSGRRIPLATATLLIAANLPDVDGLLYLLGPDVGLAHRRGWTHGVLAMAVLPLLLTAGVLAWDVWIRRRRHPDRPTAPPRTILGLAYLAMLTHPALDWLNTYGIRLLMPFDGRWFYGDSLFILDPWVWLLLGGTVFVLRAPHGRELGLWIAVAVLTSAAVLLAPAPPGLDPTVPRVVWVTGLAAIALLAAGRPSSGGRRRRRERPASPGATRALAVLGVYVLVTVLSTLVARALVLDALERRGLTVREPSRDLMVGPLPYNPFVRDVVARVGDAYRVGRFYWLPTPRLKLTDTLPLPPPSPALTAARSASCVQGFLTWVRFPYAQVETGIREGSGNGESTGPGTTVYLLDVRYTRRPTSGFGGAVVTLGEDGEPICR